LRNGQKIRIVKKILNNGEIEILATNLFDFTTDEIIELYTLRWGVETMYKIYKEHLFVEGFSGKTINSIYQDIYASLVILIGIFVFKQEAEPVVEINKQMKTTKQKARRKHEHKINISNIVSTLRDNFIFTVFFHPDKQHVDKELWRIVQIIAIALDSDKKGRSFPRIFKPHYKANHHLKV